MQIACRSRPVPFRHDDIAFHSCGTLRLCEGKLALLHTVCPIAEIRQCASGVEIADAIHHQRTRLPRLQTAFPCGGRGIEVTELRLEFASRLVADLMAGI